MRDDGREDRFEPVMAIPIGSSFGMLCGVVLGTTLIDNVGLDVPAPGRL